MALIESVVDRTNLQDPKALLPEVCDELVNRFGDKSLEYHLSQMKLQTTDAIIRAISCYFISKKLFPDKRYGKES